MGMRHIPGRLAALGACLALTALYLACGGGSSSTPTAPASTTPSPLPSNVALPSFGPVPTVPPIDPAAITDMASTSPKTVIYAVRQGDLRNDRPALAVSDINGDGVDDIVMGARLADGPGGRAGAGAVYVIFGSRKPPASVDLAQSQQSVTIYGARPGDYFGTSIAVADINGDGVKDIIVGTPFAGPTESPGVRTGRVYVFFGRRNWPQVIDLAKDQADLTITGNPGTEGWLGEDVTTGDLNGDGKRDLIVGADYDKNPSGVRAGAVYTFLGRGSWPATLAYKDADVAFYGANEFDEFGDNLAVGDFNGDGYADIAANADAARGPDRSRGTAGEVHILFGGPNVKGSYEIAKGQDNVAIYGGHAQDTLGFGVAAGDLNHDGIDDLAIAAPLASSPDGALYKSGIIYVLFGAHDLPKSIDLASPPAGMPLIYGLRPSDYLGGALAIADVAGNGKAELLAGSGFADTPDRTDAGGVLVNDVGGLTGPVSAALAHLRRLIYGAGAGDAFGANVRVGDFDGDGRPDIVAVAMNAPGPDASRAGAGRIYVIPATP